MHIKKFILEFFFLATQGQQMVGRHGAFQDTVLNTLHLRTE